MNKSIKLLYILITIIIICNLNVFLLNASYAQSSETKIFLTLRDKTTKQKIVSAKLYLNNVKQSFILSPDSIFVLSSVSLKSQRLSVIAEEYKYFSRMITPEKGDFYISIELEEFISSLENLTVNGIKEQGTGISRLGAIDGFGIYAGKKTEVIKPSDLAANLAVNQARQVLGKVPGLNIWENDGGGLQLGIGARGLSPNRTANFNCRQNGSDMSADALGYPEAYYTPPLEAVERVEIVRGAASLQYGTQFGGMVNFVLKEGDTSKRVTALMRQTLGSWGLWCMYGSVGGKVGKLQYYGSVNRREGQGWRPNSNFVLNNWYAGLRWHFSPKLQAGIQITKMYYLAKQAGGLTDALFKQDPRQSLRARNWFRVDWNLVSVNLDYRIDARSKLNIRAFSLLAGRDALGNLERINVADQEQKRNLIVDDYKNVGVEMRYLKSYNLGQFNSTLLVGGRFYKGQTTREQGEGDATAEPNFEFLNPSEPENSSFLFPSGNQAFFVENIIEITKNLTITPGFRFERIATYAEGYYKLRTLDFAGNVVSERKENDSRNYTRSFPLFGLGLSYLHSSFLEFYANISQNYRAVNFNDLRVSNPNFAVDSLLRDERGYNADLGFRGQIKRVLNYDVSLFYLSYQDRIGLVLRSDQPPLYADYRFRTNVADSYSAGFEGFVEFDVLRLLLPEQQRSGLSLFLNTSLIRSRYVRAQDASIDNRQVELVPNFIGRGGLSYTRRGFKSTLQYNYVSKQYTDATNSVFSSSAVTGLIPSYSVLDLSLMYRRSFWQVETGCNNLLNSIYFTRRADGYPGPGIIPADGRSFYITLQVKI
ncbi:MAG: TonB-dependent receptor [Cytophagales bacterium]|nr:MAG: TonB-dependent receptor [Cytophagales bacterium]TAF59877.1 MAG: TonB-dependent receptor [Cytophagales bacterium]